MFKLIISETHLATKGKEGSNSILICPRKDLLLSLLGEVKLPPYYFLTKEQEFLSSH